MHWPPCFELDLVEHGLLPADWEAQTAAAAEAPERLMIPASALTASPDDGKFSILEGPHVRARFAWLWNLYHGRLRHFVSLTAGVRCFPSNRVSSAMTLNILEGEGAEQDWHSDANAVTGVLFATTMAEGEGGELEFRHPGQEIVSVRPRAGVFVCFPGAISHRVAPLSKSVRRLSFPLIYYDSAVDQPFASAHDRYEMSAA